MDLDDIRREIAVEAEARLPESDLAQITRLMAQLARTWMPSDEALTPLASEAAPATTRDPALIPAALESLRSQARPIGPMLRTARERSGLTPGDLELGFGISQKELAWWEQGRGMVAFLDHPPRAIRELVSRLGLDPSAFALAFSTQPARQTVPARRYTTERTHMPTGKRLPVAEWVREYLSAGDPTRET